MQEVYIREITDGKSDYTKKLEAPKEEGGDLNCPIREIAVAIQGQGKSDVIPTGICTNDCLFWHTGCPFLNGTRPEDRFTTLKD